MGTGVEPWVCVCVWLSHWHGVRVHAFCFFSLNKKFGFVGFAHPPVLGMNRFRAWLAEVRVQIPSASPCARGQEAWVSG
mgnify:CR=1 FL=1